MPSVMSILSTLQRSCSYEETGVFPTVDPSQVYYVLNAQENLPDCEKKLLPVFETNKFTGLAGNFPSSDLLKEVLKTSEIFLYIGHGSASACSLSTLHFLKFPKNSLEVLKLLKNRVEVLKIVDNKLESMKILKNKFESLKLQENQPVDELIPPSTKNFYIRKCFREADKE
ncbi:RNA-directed DNA polymerase, eukaryota [Tanacetum coccineum]|uniref:separase n=1 Tax=Tanacetum coccineum TaxID=301880 RepID=A0ABQ5CXV1_9ASTR